MISHDQFGMLRLSHFCPHEEVEMLENWEFEDCLWVGEAIGFSEWLRPIEEPSVLGSLAIDFNSFPVYAATRVLDAIDLPIEPGMNLDELRSRLGKPAEIYGFGQAPDRLTYDFLIKQSYAYKISCTVLNDGGLTYFVVMAQT